MATLLYRLGKTAYRRWPVFVAAWLVALIGVAALAGTVSKPMVDTFSIPGIPSLKAQDLQKELFADTANAEDQAGVTVVVAAPEGHTLREPAYADQVDALVDDLQTLPQMPETRSWPTRCRQPTRSTPRRWRPPRSRASRPPRAEADAKALLPIDESGRVGTISWTYDVSSVADVKPATQEKLLDVLDTARDGGLTVEANGSGMQAMVEAGGKSELIGIGIALVVLIITFGSLVAAGLPILAALVGVGLGVLGISIATAFTTVGTTTPILATMVGLAVGIDYTLFILSRYRTELHHTDDREEAVGRAVGTAGLSGGLRRADGADCPVCAVDRGHPVPDQHGSGRRRHGVHGGAGGADPAPRHPRCAEVEGLRGLGAPRRASPATPTARSSTAASAGRACWARRRSPWPCWSSSVSARWHSRSRGLHLALPSDSTAAVDTTQRKASDLISDAFGPGREAPLLLVVDGRDAAAADRGAAYDDVVAWAAAKPDVANVQIVGMNEAGTGAQVLITPKSGPDAQSTVDLLNDLRADQASIEQSTATTVGVTGLTAIQTDVSDRLTDALPTYLAVVIGLAFLLLMLVFRSILVPLTATLGFLLSVLATLGATVLVFQEGLFGLVEGQPLVSFMPIIVIGIVFGLAMDYQVFLVTRMREAFVHGASAREAVVDGFRHGARVVTAAATIMISVFAAFMLQDNALIQSIGFALAAAVFFDAFVVRMVLIPSVMYLLGDAAWWLPRWLDRLLPNVDVEGEALTAMQVPDDARAVEEQPQPVG